MTTAGNAEGAAAGRRFAGASTYVALALLAPPAYLGYGLAVLQAKGIPFVAPRVGPRTALATLVVVEFATLTLLAYRMGLRLSPALATVSLLAWPWVSASVPFGGTDVLVPWVVTLYVGSVELSRTRPDLLADPDGRHGLAAGAALFVGGIAIQTATRPYLLDVSEGFWWIGTLFVAVPGVGLVWIGTTSVLLWRRARLVGPAVVVGIWTTWILQTMVRNLERYPLPQSSGFGLLADPAADVRASWVLAALGLVAVAGVEYWLRRRRLHADVEVRQVE